MWKKIKAFISRDEKNENEVKMYAIIMRILMIITGAYFITSMFFGAVNGQYGEVVYALVCVALSLLFFVETYYNQTKFAFYGSLFLYALHMFMHTYFYGVGTGVYQIVYVMIMLIFVVNYCRNKKLQFIGLVLVLIYRVLIYIYGTRVPPIYELNQKFDAFWLFLHMVFYALMVVACVIISTADFSEMRKKLTTTNARFRDMAGKDPLTGLYNRRAAQEYLKDQVELYNSGQISSLTLAMADVDHFKVVNDTYGHDNGDIVLSTLANTMGVFMRGRGIPARWGGEEFLMVFVNSNGDETNTALYELQKEISKHSFEFNGEELKITLTYGVAEYGSGLSFEDTVKEADEKLYIGKEKGRNVIIF